MVGRKTKKEKKKGKKTARQEIEVPQVKKTFRVYLFKGEELGFSVLPGQSLAVANPVVIKGPITETWPPARLKALFPGVAVKDLGTSYRLQPRDPQADLERSIRQLAHLAFRDRVTDREIEL